MLVGGEGGNLPYLECRLAGPGTDGAACTTDGLECAGGFTCASGATNSCRQICLVGDPSTCDAGNCEPYSSSPNVFAGRQTGRCLP